MGWKIVRDRQPAYCRENGVSGQWRVSPDPVRALMKKLFEEAGEFAEALDPAELYDLGDVLRELTILLDPDGKHQAAHAEKLARLGRFGMHLEWHPEPDPADAATREHMRRWGNGEEMHEGEGE